MIHLIRILFLLLVSAVALTYSMSTVDAVLESKTATITYAIMVSAVVITFAIIAVDALIKKKNLMMISGLFFGLIVGMVVSLGLGFLVDNITNVYVSASVKSANQPLIEGVKLLVGLITCYLTVSFILQTRDDFRFIVPYVEFTRATKGPRPILLDTSVIIDGRVADLAAAGIFESRILVPRFVLNELQAVADSADRLKRSRGRRGLDVLHRLQAMPKLELHMWDGSLINSPESEGVDQKLVALAQQEHARLFTNDFNLQKIAQLRGVDVVNMNSIADAVKPVVLPGETMKVRIVKPGESHGQGVGYLDDGTMVVVETARDKVGQEMVIIVTNALQTAAGKMIFGRPSDEPVKTVK